jgi:GNAT superfamily N-acetyltransferase
MTSGMFVLRQATVADADVIARQRARMFSEMGLLAGDRTAELMEKASHYLRVAMPRGEYVGWVAEEDGGHRAIVGGAGVQVRNTLPHPRTPPGAPHGREAIVLNVYTEPAWRGHGVAERLMRQVITWAGEAGIHSLVLHASEAGRPLYERLGFAATNEMRYTGTLGAVPARPGPAERKDDND